TNAATFMRTTAARTYWDTRPRRFPRWARTFFRDLCIRTISHHSKSSEKTTPNAGTEKCLSMSFACGIRTELGGGFNAWRRSSAEPPTDVQNKFWVPYPTSRGSRKPNRNYANFRLDCWIFRMRNDGVLLVNSMM